MKSLLSRALFVCTIMAHWYWRYTRVVLARRVDLARMRMRPRRRRTTPALAGEPGMLLTFPSRAAESLRFTSYVAELERCTAYTAQVRAWEEEHKRRVHRAEELRVFEEQKAQSIRQGQLSDAEWKHLCQPRSLHPNNRRFG